MRNPQIVAGSLLVLGSVVLWPSWQAVVWLILYGVVGHLMVMTEEVTLLALHGEVYGATASRFHGMSAGGGHGRRLPSGLRRYPRPGFRGRR